MTCSNRGRVRSAFSFGGTVCSLCVFGGKAFAGSQTSIFDPAATPARSDFGLSMLVLSVTLVIFLIVAGLLLYALIRFRHRPRDSDREPAQIYGSNQIELSWTVIPILIVVMLFLSTTRVILGTQAIPKPASAMDVTVIGHQFWWEYRYPKLGVVTANELHVPVSDPAHPTPTYLTMSSADVDHSFWVPRLAGKTDLIPNRVNTMWIDPQQAGLYLGQCAQYCGAQHAKMLLRVYAQISGGLCDAWVEPAEEARAAGLSRQPRCRGRPGRLHAQRLHQLPHGCRHRGDGPLRARPDAPGQPRHDCFRRRFENTPENLRKWIDDPKLDEARLPDAGDAFERSRSGRHHRLSDRASLTLHRKEARMTTTPVVEGIDETAGQQQGRPPLNVIYEWLTTVDHKKIGLMYIVVRADLSCRRRR